jgi:DNA-binding CsgD family transcriptional regulator
VVQRSALASGEFDEPGGRPTRALRGLTPPDPGPDRTGDLKASVLPRVGGSGPRSTRVSGPGGTSLGLALASCQQGKGQVVTVSGPVASGKTELVNGFGDYAAGCDAVVLTAAGAELEQEFAFGLVRQLIQAAGAGLDVPSRIIESLDRITFADVGAGGGPSSSAVALIRHELCSAVLDLARRAPVVIVVDDVQFTDAPSGEFLMYLARRIRTERVLLVLVERPTRAAGGYPRILAELERQGGIQQLRVDLLTPERAAAVFAERVGISGAGELSAELHAVSGGSPLLVNALAEDHLAAHGAQAPARIEVGDSFRRAVRSCLYRMDAGAFQVATALAVFGDRPEPARLDGLLGVGVAEVEWALHSLQAAGLVDDDGFRHPATAESVLDGLTSEERQDLHRRTAALLHAEGSAPAEVARHLLASGWLEPPWALPTVRWAADQAMASGHLDFALNCLKLAQRGSPGEREAAEATVLLIGMEWLLDPASAGRHGPWLADAVDQGWLTGRYALLAVRYFAWYGQTDEAMRALELFGDPVSGLDVQTAVEAWTASALLRFWFPGLRERVSTLADWTRDIPAIRSRLDGLDVLVTVGLGQGDDLTVARIEQILRRSRLDDSTIESLSSALTALTYVGQAARSERWCRQLLPRADGHHAPVVSALLHAILAESLLRQGNLEGAAEAAETALDRLPAAGWGVLLGLPLAAAIAANTALGRLEEAARYVDVPVPNQMFRTPAGLQYLHACGRYHRARRRPEAALHAFRTCGDLMREWGMDVSGLVPWRTSAAAALRDLGEEAPARDLVEEELRRLPRSPSRERAVALRLRAGTLELRRRPAALWGAVEMATEAGDRYEAAAGLTDLTVAYLGLGEIVRARKTALRAAQLAQQCSAGTLLEALPGELLAGPGEEPEEPQAPAPGPPHPELSEAERRVAQLAAQGHTNREISRRLFVTMSTVEQHLTQVYRKLGVSRRTQLPTRIG